MADSVSQKSDKAVESEIEHTKHGPEYYDRNADELPHHEDHLYQEHTVHGNEETGDHPPHVQHGGPDEQGE
jgi:hypothetical protein